jgi:hypothetical protein
MKIWIALFAAVLALVAYAGSGPTVAKKQVDAPSTEVEAAIYALSRAYNDHPHYYEYGGVIVKMANGKFNASAPTTEGNATHIDINEDPEKYDGHYPVVSDYHTHPCIEGYVPGVFSAQDLISMREYQRGGYILDECTGDVHYWKPGDAYDKPDPKEGIDVLSLFRDRRSAAGIVVGKIPVDGKQFSLE